MQRGDNAVGYTPWAYNTDIEQTIVATGLPGVFEGSSIELCITNYNLQGSCFDRAFIDLKGSAEGWITENLPDTYKQIAQDTKALGWFLLNDMGNLAVHPDASHQQKIAIINASQIDAPGLPIYQNSSG